MDLDRLVAAVAAGQLGVFTLAQAVAAGATPEMVRRRVAAGRWLRVHRGVFRLAGCPESWEQAVMAAWLAAGSGAVVSHATAAIHWGIPGISRRLEISVPAGRRPRPAGVTIHRPALLRRADVVDTGTFPVTTPTRTLLDVAGMLDADRLGAALDHCLSRRLTTVDYLTRRLDARGRQGRAGMSRLAELLAERPSSGRAPESEFERMLLRLLERLPGPRPVPQCEVRLPNGRVARLDVAYPAHKLDVEADSYTYHASRTDWAFDHTRNAALVAMGWRILPVTWDQVTRTPDRVLSLVARALSLERCS